MRKALIAFGIFILCLPLFFSLWLLAAVQSPKLDHITQQTPSGLRQFVASAVMGNAGFGKKSLPAVERALRLDPENAEALDRKCSLESSDNTPASLEDCQKSLRIKPTAEAYYNVGNAQLEQGNVCDAETNLTEAASKSSSSGNAWYLNRMGVAAIRCNDLPGARAALEAALDQDNKSLNAPNQEQDDLDEDHENILSDQELLVIVYQDQHEKGLEAATCKAAHPDKPHCNCAIGKDNNPTCT